MKLKKRRSLTSLMRSGPTPKETVIPISVDGGKETRHVDAYVLGGLATHKEYCADSPGLFPNGGKPRWVVTHRRTGCAVIGAIAFATKKQCMQIMKECAAGPWDFGEFGVVPPASVFREARRMVREAGARVGLKLKKERFVKRVTPKAVP